MPDSDFPAQINAAIVGAILETCRSRAGGIVVDRAVIRQALCACIAMVLEADATIKTNKDMREASEIVARDVRVQLHGFRDHYGSVGRRTRDPVLPPSPY